MNSTELTLSQIDAVRRYYEAYQEAIDQEIQSKGWTNRIVAAAAEHLRILEEIFTTEHPLTPHQLAELAKLLKRGRVHVQQFRDEAQLEMLVILEPLVKALDVLLSEVDRLSPHQND